MWEWFNLLNSFNWHSRLRITLNFTAVNFAYDIEQWHSTTHVRSFFSLWETLEELGGLC